MTSQVSSDPRARSSAGEHSLHTRGVAGSIPAAPILEAAANLGVSCLVVGGRLVGRRFAGKLLESGAA